jgi:hypothetical protein
MAVEIMRYQAHRQDATNQLLTAANNRLRELENGAA